MISLTNNSDDEIKKFVDYLIFLGYRRSIIPIEKGCVLVLYETIKDIDVCREYLPDYEIDLNHVFNNIIEFKKFMFKKRLGHEKVK